MNYSNVTNMPNNMKTAPKPTPKFGSGPGNVYEDADSNKVEIEDFLQLMIQQLSNQDFMNPVDDTQYLTQMATFATMQQMEQLAYYAKSNFAISLAGKDVTVAKLGVGGQVDKSTGPVEKIIYIDDEYKIYVNGQQYKLNQIMEIHGASQSNNDVEKPDIPVTNLFTIGIQHKTKDSVTIDWEIPEINGQDSNDFKYSVYYSKDRIFNTVKDVKKGTLVGTEDQKNIDSIKVEHLDPNTTYYFNVVMEDANGVESVYSKGIATTLPK